MKALSSIRRISGIWISKTRLLFGRGCLLSQSCKCKTLLIPSLNLYGSHWVGAVVTIVYYVIGFVLVVGVLRWILERYFKGKSQPEPSPPPPFGPPQKVSPLIIKFPGGKIASRRSTVRSEWQLGEDCSGASAGRSVRTSCGWCFVLLLFSQWTS